ncbi:hypothetical protein AND_002887 [Anopheles darlingi]|uniref:Secreted protein n=1 Tax=Anopheles darlingi TaxID=43151 RepID=W5JLW7_ANODA|nr:hypothetical protein AND_002887 [Anopheles darlingi]
MKLLIVLSVLAGVAYAERPGAVLVIDTFKEIAPQYAGTLAENEQKVEVLQKDGGDEIAKFHSDIITIKETFVGGIIRAEDELLDAIDQTGETSVACTTFISTAEDANVNLVGVSFTKCINAADDALNTTAATYYNLIGELGGSLTDLRLLDVFRNDNVFYTPQNIVDKLQAKLSGLAGINSPTTQEMQENIDALEDELAGIRDNYITCMTSADLAYQAYMDLARSQLELICGPTVIITT